VPFLLGLLTLSAGIWLMQGWEAAAPLVRVLAVLLTIAGSVILLLVSVLVLAVFLIARFVKGLKRDISRIGYSLRYMATMGRPGRPSATVVDVVAQHPTSTPQESSTALPPGNPDDPPENPPDGPGPDHP